jgi:two-component system response regulator YesN
MESGGIIELSVFRDGDEVVVKRCQERSKFIMLTAYDSFEYAKLAMKEGVKEYLLKPANQQETIEAFLRVADEIAEEKEKGELAAA